MVSSIISENEDTVPVIKALRVGGIPPGDYKLVGCDMDTTGKKLSDEICQIAGYTPDSTFAQYVMPYKNLSPPAKKRHNLKIVTMGNFRLLKDAKTNKVIKTKSEISALTDFLTWLESMKSDAADGIILIHHEQRKVIPAMLLDSLRKYNLLDRFKESVKGFANGFNIATKKCPSTIHNFSMRTLSRVLLDQKKTLDNAENRACLALQIVQRLCTGEDGLSANEGKGDSDVASKAAVELVREFVQPIDAEEKEYENLQLVLERQYSLGPIFKPLLAASRRERQHATPLRRLLAESNIDYVQLEEAWSKEQMTGVEKLINEKVTSADEKNLADLLEILKSHFVPEEKSTVKAVTVPKKRRSKKSRADDSGIQSPDTTIAHSSDEMKTQESVKLEVELVDAQ